ncbi:hypothetical protein BDQ17DRAFT_1338685 [Cyathus striatus]|nr:hypothetical protein BDQ17DRAFT_1338685 [Cyathus striatus]
MSNGSKSNPDYERSIQAAIEGAPTLPKKYKNLKQAAKTLDVNYNTLLDRSKGKLSYKDAATNRRRLKPTEEEILLNWLKNDAESGQPWDNRTLRDRATYLAGRRVGNKPSKLDPKRAKNFNETVFWDFFDKLNSIYEQYGDILPEQIYNMDEKGIQLGGGRKNDPRKYMYYRGPAQSVQNQ